MINANDECKGIVSDDAVLQWAETRNEDATDGLLAQCQADNYFRSIIGSDDVESDSDSVVSDDSSDDD
jgi:hypothetical protein